MYEQSGLGPENVDVIELHDCFSCNELITYEGLGLGGACVVTMYRRLGGSGKRNVRGRKEVPGAPAVGASLPADGSLRLVAG